jgi:hypothetical protein
LGRRLPGYPRDVARIEEPRRNLFRLVGRGREESTPLYLHHGVLLTVALVAGIVVALVFAARAFA